MNSVQIRRIYDSYNHDDGYRVLVDRLWPRGIRKTEACLDEWNRDIAPSTELRKSFAHQAERFGEFRTAYRKELDENPEALQFVRSCETILQERNITLLYAARDEACNNAAVLCEWIQQKTEK